ncbi:hypothetical protein Vadar_012322 [Vaccinium darrowii]|uniref:Uncharacterized protein n=1 Tax=Vaccinium darrowii TaxID=229202 RepID=A0ACB7ZB16_9ERIC|nr:hypothetical protein Vadar_012322 [Vaccinium darrowii]
MFESPSSLAVHGFDTSSPSQPEIGNNPSENSSENDGNELAENENAPDKDDNAKLRSVYWKHYDRVQINGVYKAICMYCCIKISGNTNNRTLHSIQHYNQKHKKREESMRQQVLTNNFNKDHTPQGPPLPSYSYDQDTARKELASAIIMHEYLLSIVDHVGFKRPREVWSGPAGLG